MSRTRRGAPTLDLRAAKRAYALIEALLKEMQRGVKDPALLESAEWERLFGVKQNMVVNLQKLVQALSALPEPATTSPSKQQLHQEGATLSAEEMQLLSAWIAEEAANDQ